MTVTLNPTFFKNNSVTEFNGKKQPSHQPLPLFLEGNILIQKLHKIFSSKDIKKILRRS